MDMDVYKVNEIIKNNPVLSTLLQNHTAITSWRTVGLSQNKPSNFIGKPCMISKKIPTGGYSRDSAFFLQFLRGKQKNRGVTCGYVPTADH